MWNCVMNARADMLRGAHMSRFVLISAALHLGLLAALSYNIVRPQFQPSTLSVTLNQATDTTAKTSHHSGTPRPSIDPKANTTREELKPAAHSAPSKRIEPQRRPTAMLRATDTTDQPNRGISKTKPSGETPWHFSKPNWPWAKASLLIFKSKNPQS